MVTCGCCLVSSSARFVSALPDVLALESLLWRLESLWGILDKLGCGKAVGAYVDDVTITISDEAQLPCVEDALKRYKVVAEAKINKDKSISLQLGTW